jgi:hypothetical protein
MSVLPPNIGKGWKRCAHVTSSFVIRIGCLDLHPREGLYRPSPCARENAGDVNCGSGRRMRHSFTHISGCSAVEAASKVEILIVLGAGAMILLRSLLFGH